MSTLYPVIPLRHVEARLVREPWPWAEANRPAIAEFWRKVALEKPAMFNGQVLVCASREIRDGTLHTTYRETDYASFLAWREFGWPDPTVANCFSMAALRGSDGAYVLGEMGTHTANPGKIYFAAGTPDLGDIVEGDRVDLAGSVLRELHEEMGLEPHEVTIAEGWALVDEFPRLALMREIRSELTADELKARIERWLSTQHEPELCAVHIARTSRDIALERMPPFMGAFLAHALR